MIFQKLNFKNSQLFLLLLLLGGSLFFSHHAYAVSASGTCSNAANASSANTCPWAFSADWNSYFTSASYSFALSQGSGSAPSGYATLCLGNTCQTSMWTVPTVWSGSSPITISGNTSEPTTGASAFVVLYANQDASQTVNWTLSANQTCLPGYSGSPCSAPGGGTCTDGIQNQNETGIDTGGVCGGGGGGGGFPPPNGGAQIACSVDASNWLSGCSVLSNQTYYIQWRCTGTYTFDGYVDNRGNRWTGDPISGPQGTFTDTLAAGSTTYLATCEDNDLPPGDPNHYSNASAGIGVVPPAPPNAPTGLTLSNGDCGHIIVGWTDNSSNETGFKILRRTVSGAYATISNNLPAIAGTGSNGTYIDPTAGQPGSAPLAETTYYYEVQAFNANGTTNSAEKSVLNRACIANLATFSAKNIYKINGVGYASSAIIKDGDTVTFRIKISNSGNTNATINYICDTPSANFTKLRNLAVTGGGSGSTITPADASCSGNYRFNVTGSKSYGQPIDNNPWFVTYDTTFLGSSTGTIEACSNVSTINYTDTATTNQTLSYGPTLCNGSGVAIPNFQEVAP